MRYKKKLELLNDYVEINRILLKCKSMIILKLNLDTEKLNKACNLAIKLKNIYLEKIKECGMYDDAFITLKKDIDTAVQYNIYTHNLSNSTLDGIQSTLDRLQNNSIS